MNTSYIQLALDIKRGRWLLDNAEALLPHALDFLSRLPSGGNPAAESVRAFGPDGGEIPDAADRKVLVACLHGVMTKYDTCENNGTAGLAAAVSEAAGNDKAAGIVIDIDSPGGAVSSVAPLIEALNYAKSQRLPVIAHCDTCCSAAYWVASQCDSVFMDNSLSECGSIGAYCSFIDDRENRLTGERVVSVYARESGDKNLAYREALEGRYEVCRDELSEIVAEFHRAVMSGRPALRTDAPGVLTGGVFTARKAVDLGLADGIMTLSQCIENVFIRSIYH